MILGYARVSTEEQDTQGQIDALEKFGCDKIFQEHIGGKSTKNRPELLRLLDSLRDGDIVVVQRLDRLGRSLKDLIELLDKFRSENVQFISLSENIDTTTPSGELTFHLIAAIAQFERALISERTKTGLAVARARGRKGGRKPVMLKSDVKKAKAMLLDHQVTKSEVARHFNVSRPTLNKYLDID